MKRCCKTQTNKQTITVIDALHHIGSTMAKTSHELRHDESGNYNLKQNAKSKPRKPTVASKNSHIGRGHTTLLHPYNGCRIKLTRRSTIKRMLFLSLSLF
jgi:hypothetical protein